MASYRIAPGAQADRNKVGDGRKVGAATRRAIFFDRDGVLNKAEVRDGLPFPPARIADFQIVDEAEMVLGALKNQGFLLFAVSNQPDVARGKQSSEVVEQMNAILNLRLPLDEILVCYHDDSDACTCRKPLPGMLLNAAMRHNIDLEHSYMVGDRWKDVLAGERAGCRTILIDCGYAEKGPIVHPSASVTSLTEGMEWILHDLKATP
ncbi:MAG: HAD-IIIA family hydrolase [Vulcanimicrobiaceae bacterium]